MKGMSLTEFIDKVYWGDEIEFRYLEKTYFLQGYYNTEKKLHIRTLDAWTKCDGSEPFENYLYESKSETREDCVEKFINAKIFNGNSLYEVEKDITVDFG